MAKDAGSDRATRYTRDPRQLWKAGELVQTPQRPEMKKHRAVTASREAEGEARSGWRCPVGRNASHR